MTTLGLKFSEETRKKMRDAKIGRKNHNWKGGIRKTKEYNQKQYQKRKLYFREWYRERNGKKYGVIYPKEIDCYICGRHIVEGKIDLDHDHKTEKFRGWLCRKCNVSLGWFESKREKVLNYLR